VCLGAQLLAETAGGEAVRASEPEIGWFDVEVTPEGAVDPLLASLAPSFEAFEWHSYECRLPEDAVVLARTPLCVQAFRVGPSAWAIQFHAEVSAADALHWIDDYKADEDAVRIGIDPAALRAETEPRIEAFNQLGRDLCGRWLAAIA
jgi:GMP synthase (glutamine-hydrolysing)